MAPSMYKWDYVGGDDDSPEAARRGEQRVYAGDLVMDDVFGQGQFVRFEGSNIVIEFGSGETMEQKDRTKGHVRAVANRDARPTRDVPVGRTGQNGAMARLLGGPPQVATGQGIGAGGRGRGGGRGRRGGAFGRQKSPLYDFKVKVGVDA
jgi:hypothetical protein